MLSGSPEVISGAPELGLACGGTISGVTSSSSGAPEIIRPRGAAKSGAPELIPPCGGLTSGAPETIPGAPEMTSGAPEMIYGC